MEKYISKMAGEISSALSGNEHSIYIIGSCASSDFRYGWSDIDIVCFTERALSEDNALRLLYLRQMLSSKSRKQDLMRVFEGAILPFESFLGELPDKVVYWGKSGERITQRYTMSAMSKIDLIDNGILVSGNDVRHKLKRPNIKDICHDTRVYLRSVERELEKPKNTFGYIGTMLDISRCIHTLETNTVISKSKAGLIAIEKNWCSSHPVMRKILEIRENPCLYRNSKEMENLAFTLSPHIEYIINELKKRLCTA